MLCTINSLWCGHPKQIISTQTHTRAHEIIKSVCHVLDLCVIHIWFVDFYEIFFFVSQSSIQNTISRVMSLYKSYFPFITFQTLTFSPSTESACFGFVLPASFIVVVAYFPNWIRLCCECDYMDRTLIHLPCAETGEISAVVVVVGAVAAHHNENTSARELTFLFIIYKWYWQWQWHIALSTAP